MSNEQLGLDGSVSPVQTEATDPEVRDLEAILKLWAEADALHDEAEELKDEARGKEMLSEDKLDAASDIIKDLVVVRPEWKARLDDGKDPRITGWAD